MLKKPVFKSFSFFIVVLLVSGFLVLLQMTPIVSATTYTENFEDETLNQQVNDAVSGLNTSKVESGDTFEVDDLLTYKGFYMQGTVGNSYGWWNFTHTTSFLTKIIVDYCTDLTTGGGYYCFFNQTQYDKSDVTKTYTSIYSDSDSMIIIRSDGLHLYYYDHNGAEQLIAHTSQKNWMSFQLEILDDDSVDYVFNNVTIHGSPRNVTAFVNDYKIDRVFFTQGSIAIGWDNLQLIYSSAYGSETGGSSALGDTTDFDSVCNMWDPYNYKVLDEKYIEIKYNNPVNYNNLQVIDLLVNDEQYDGDSVLSNYELNINGNNEGPPSYFYAFDDDTYVLRWYGIDRNIKADYIILEFYHSAKYNDAYYWSLPRSAYDNNDDGIFYYKTHNNDDLYGNNVFDGGIELGDPIYCMFFDPIVYDWDIDTDYDTIGVSEGVHYTYETVFISYAISAANMSYDNYIYLYCNNTLVGELQGFPYYVTSRTRTYGYVPFNSGSYAATIRRSNSNVSSINFTVVSNPSSSHIWCYPNPVPTGVGYIVGYNYTHAQGKLGEIYYSYDGDFNDGVKIIDGLTANTSDTFPYFETSQSVIYFSLCVNVSTNNHVLVDQFRLFVLNSVDNMIDVDPVITINQACNLGFWIVGRHSNIGSDVYITINGDRITGVGDTNVFAYKHKICKTGNYNASLMLRNSNRTVMLDYHEFIVKSEEYNAEYETGNYNYMPVVGFALALAFGFVGMYAGGGGFGFIGGFFGTMIVFSIPNTPMCFFEDMLWMPFLFGLALVLLIFSVMRR